MTYPNAHLLLTAHWSYISATSEKAQIGLRFDTTTAASQALVDACAGPWVTFWGNAIAGIDFGFQLEFLRLASIGTDGKYVPTSIAYDHVFSGVRGGGSSGAETWRFPLQTAQVTRLNTALPRGQAHEGRVYLPWPSQPLQTGFTWALAVCNNRSNAFSALLSSLNSALPGPLSVFSKGTKAAPTVGAKHAVTNVTTGNKPDTQRRRAAQLPETQGAPFTI